MTYCGDCFLFFFFKIFCFPMHTVFQFICIFCIQYFRSLISIYTLIIFARCNRYCLKNCPSCFSGSSITYSKILMNSFHHLCMPRGKECERCFLILPWIEWFNPCLITLSSLFSLLIFVTFNICKYKNKRGLILCTNATIIFKILSVAKIVRLYPMKMHRSRKICGLDFYFN